MGQREKELCLDSASLESGKGRGAEDRGESYMHVVDCDCDCDFGVVMVAFLLTVLFLLQLLCLKTVKMKNIAFGIFK